VKGVVYIVVGALAFQVAAHLGGRVTGTRGVFTTVLAQPFGRTLLLVAAVGLLGYAAWRILQGFFDPDRLGHGWRGLALRVSFVALGVVHAALGLQAFRVYRGLSAASGISERTVATEAFAWPFGDWLVVLAGSASSASPCSRSTQRLPADWNAISMSQRCDAKPASGRSPSAGSAWRHALSSLRCWDGASPSRVGSAMRLSSAPWRRRCASSPHNREEWAGGFSA
jgi:uncharacterized protein DUF1206